MNSPQIVVCHPTVRRYHARPMRSKLAVGLLAIGLMVFAVSAWTHHAHGNYTIVTIDMEGCRDRVAFADSSFLDVRGSREAGWAEAVVGARSGRSSPAAEDWRVGRKPQAR